MSLLHLIHYGTNEYKRKYFREIVDQTWITKPEGGLWASPIYSNFGWKEWCESAGFRNVREECSFKFDFDGSLLTIDQVSDLEKLVWIQERVSKVWYISFESCNYDAVYLTERGERCTRLTYPKGLYGWDCESVLILNPNSIKHIR